MKIKKKYAYFSVAVIIVLALSLFYFNPFAKKSIAPEKDTGKALWSVDKNGYLYYPLDRGGIEFSRANYSETGSLVISRIVYPSKGTNIYGLLVLPKYVSRQIPGVVLLPGAGVAKESELPLAEKIAELGVAVLTIDQRGVGETDGNFPSLDEDYSNFLQSKEPYQHLMVYDALRGYDLLYSATFVDPGRIIMAGESLGGRVAVIAAAVDRNVKGVLVISSAGFDFVGGPDEKKNIFVKSIDSDHYIDLITPRKIVMMHNLNDNIISLNSAVNSYSRAQNPKSFVLVNDTACNHGYCDSMYNGLVEGINFLIG